MKQTYYGKAEQITHTTSVTRDKRRAYDRERVERLRTWGMRKHSKRSLTPFIINGERYYDYTVD